MTYIEKQTERQRRARRRLNKNDARMKRAQRGYRPRRKGK